MRRLCGRSSAYCLQQAYEIPSVTVICDNMAGYLMSQGLVDKVIVGADRVTLQGRAANKISTYSLAVLAHYHKIPLLYGFSFIQCRFLYKRR